MITPMLEILSGDLAGRSYEMDEERFTIGRSPSCDIVIPKRYISREHAQIVCEGQDYVIDGLSRKNPVLVDARPISEHVLADGDEFELCGIRFRFLLPQARRSGVGNSVVSGSAFSGRVSRIGGSQVGETSDDSWEEESDLPLAPRRSNRGQVVFGAEDPGDESEDDEQTGEIALDRLTQLSSRSSASGVGEAPLHGESSSERTAELGRKLDPDDPDYDPFAEVEATQKKKAQVDPQKEKTLRLLVVVGIVGIALAMLIRHKLNEQKPYTTVPVDVPITVAVGQTLLFEEPWSTDDPPYVPGYTRTDGVPTADDYLVDDAVASVEWVCPHVQRRAILLVKGKSESETTFLIWFPRRRVRKEFTVKVVGIDPHELERDTLREEVAEKSPRELKNLIDSHLASGEILRKERDVPGKEGYYRSAWKEFAAAAVSADALRTKLAARGALAKEIVNLVRRCEDEEAKARDELQNFIDREFSLYGSYVHRNEPADVTTRQLKRVLRAINHECDERYKRLLTILKESYSDTMDSDGSESCKHDPS